jgi:hypothetical protein
MDNKYRNIKNILNPQQDGGLKLVFTIFLQVTVIVIASGR